MRVPWTARRSNQSILKEISLECSLDDSDTATTQPPESKLQNLLPFACCQMTDLNLLNLDTAKSLRKKNAGNRQAGWVWRVVGLGVLYFIFPGFFPIISWATWLISTRLLDAEPSTRAARSSSPRGPNTHTHTHTHTHKHTHTTLDSFQASEFFLPPSPSPGFQAPGPTPNLGRGRRAWLRGSGRHQARPARSRARGRPQGQIGRASCRERV